MMHIRPTTRWSLPTLLCLALLALCAWPTPAHAQKLKPVKWTTRLVPADTRAGETAQVVVEATIDAPWHIYSQKKYEGLGPKPTTTELIKGGGVLTENGPVAQPPPHVVFDKGFNIDVEDYPGAVAFGIPVVVSPGIVGKNAAGIKVVSQACKDGACLAPAKGVLKVIFEIQPGEARPDRTKPILAAPAQPKGYVAPPAKPGGNTTGGAPLGPGAPGPGGPPGGTPNGLFGFLLVAISAGFLALLTPCVFPMIPVTVSFFSKQQETSGKPSYRGPLAYSLGIILTFTALGIIVSAIFGASGIQRLAGNPIVNLGLAILFVVLAVNLFGGFEILLPSWMLEKAQSGTGAGGLVGPMLMGLTFTLTSFTCTVPFVGTLLASTAKGDYFWPALGMLGFSTAFALPFFLLAMFPQFLNRLPRSGSWLVTVKAYMGFLELAAALKFLSNVELSLQLPPEKAILTQPAFLAIWFTIMIVAAAYMMGWLNLPHSPQDVAIGPIRRGIGILTAVAGVYCLSGINGSSLGWFSGLLPPRSYGMVAGSGQHPTAVKWLHDLDAAFAQAKAEDKLVMVNFTGIYCTNCRTVEENVFTRPEVAGAINRFVPVELYTDRGDAESNKNQGFQEKTFNAVTLPLYAVMTPDGKVVDQLSLPSLPPDLSILARDFVAFLEGANRKVGSLATR